MSSFVDHFFTASDRIVRFLWVHPKIVDLQAQHTDTDIRNALGSFPNDLELMYTNILRSIDSLPSPRRRRVKRTLRWVVCAKRPLTVTQLSEAVAIDEMTEIWDEARLVNDPPSSLIEDASDLVFRKGGPWWSPNAEVYMIHKSVTDFLLHRLALLDSSLTGYCLSLPTAQVAIVRECFKYFSLVAEQQGDHVEHRHRLLMYACNCWPEHLRDAGLAGKELVSDFSELMQPTSLCRELWLRHYNGNRYAIPLTSLLGPSHWQPE